jgi:xanthine/uracil/vitamin C permease (AzgA family)
MRFLLPVIIPMGLFNVLGSVQNLESAAAAGDVYETAPSLTVNGLGSIIAAAFGSCFPTTIYIGHPGWKALGARAGYSILNGVFFCVVALLGLSHAISALVPIEAGMAMCYAAGTSDIPPKQPSALWRTATPLTRWWRACSDRTRSPWGSPPACPGKDPRA